MKKWIEKRRERDRRVATCAFTHLFSFRFHSAPQSFDSSISDLLVNFSQFHFTSPFRAMPHSRFLRFAIVSSFFFVFFFRSVARSFIRFGLAIGRFVRVFFPLDSCKRHISTQPCNRLLFAIEREPTVKFMAHFDRRIKYWWQSDNFHCDLLSFVESLRAHLGTIFTFDFRFGMRRWLWLCASLANNTNEWWKKLDTKRNRALVAVETISFQLSRVEWVTKTKRKRDSFEMSGQTNVRLLRNEEMKKHSYSVQYSSYNYLLLLSYMDCSKTNYWKIMNRDGWSRDICNRLA